MTTTVALEHRSAQLRRGRMHYVTAGSGRGLLLLHGWPGFWFDYRHVIGDLAGLGQVVAPDFLGFGQSSPLLEAGPEAADEDRFAEDLSELLELLGLDGCIVVGHDIGSAVAPALARIAPDRVGGLVLLNPTHPSIGDKRYTPEAQREAWYQHFHVLPLAADLIDGDAGRVRTYLGHFYAHWAGVRAIDPDDFDVVVDTYARPGAFAASLAWYRGRAARRQASAPAATIRTRTIALWGDRDPMRPLAHREGFERAFPNSASRVLAGVGHFVPAEAPAAVVEAVTDLL
jgi:pimeloyl-ACP methyl ester carboxylesterase